VLVGVAVVCVLAPPALAHPGSGIAVDGKGQVYFLDTGSGLWRIDTKGVVTRLSRERNHWLALDPGSRFSTARLPTDPAHDWVITAVGSDPTVLISTDFPIAVGPDGSLYYKVSRFSQPEILQMTQTRPIPFFRLPAPIDHVNGLAVANDRSIYFTDDNTVRRIDINRRLTTIAAVSPLATGKGVPGVEHRPYLRGLALDANGTIYVADSADARVLKIAPNGTVTTILQIESPWAPTAVARFDDNTYVQEYLHTVEEDRLAWLPRIRKVSADGSSTIIATVERMPGARPGPPARVAGFGRAFDNLFHPEFQNPFLDRSLRDHSNANF
jgi:sugar lactone lactonase YvrE